MKIKLLKLWDSLHSSYWFVPSLMSAIAIALALATLTLDRTGKLGPIEKFAWSYAGGPEGARTVLSTVAGSMITVAGTVFSIVIVALTLASSQFGPRMLRNYMQDTGNQIVLGTFIGTFIYCLFVLRTIRGDDYDVFVPQISVTVGIGLALTSIGVLIYFIHHASISIQVWHVIGEVGKDLYSAIDRLFPDKLGQSSDKPKQRIVAEIPFDFDQESAPILAKGSGYLEAIDEHSLMEVATEQDLLLRLQNRPGNFVVEGHPLVRVWPGKRATDELSEQINQAFILGWQRTEQQDVEFCINQLVEIAVRALSPGINDPFTAIQCIDTLSAALAQLVQRDFPSPYRYDDQQNLRVIANPVTFPELADHAFIQIRHYGGEDIMVMMQLLKAIALIGAHTQQSKDRHALLHHAEIIWNVAETQVSQPSDLQRIQERYLAAVQVLDER